MEPNKYDIEMLKKEGRFSVAIKSVENKDTLVSVNEPDQNMLNFMSANGYFLVNCVQFGSNDEGMCYDCIFRRSFMSYAIQSSVSGRIYPEENLEKIKDILNTLKGSSECNEGIEKHEKLNDETWKCLNCGHNEIKFNNKCDYENCSFPECNHICGYNPDKKQE